jgi:hypothetical protein
MSEPNCYNCKWRTQCSGDTHSKCTHPKNEEALSNSLIGLAILLRSVDTYDLLEQGVILKVKGNPHGIKNGWFQYPFNFDPVWLEECEGFTLKDNLPAK